MFSLMKNQPPIKELRLSPALKLRRLVLAIGMTILGLTLAFWNALSILEVLFILAFLSGISSNWSA